MGVWRPFAGWRAWWLGRSFSQRKRASVAAHSIMSREAYVNTINEHHQSAGMAPSRPYPSACPEARNMAQAGLRRRAGIYGATR